MGRPTPSVLFSQSFWHHHPGEHVDEVRFSEPVVITACEILEQQATSLCRSISLTGVSSPPSFSVEIFVRNGGDARFKRLCHAFLYSASAPPLQDAQVTVTDHLVLRGTYDSLTLVLYGNLASSVGQVNGDHDLDSPLPDLFANEMSGRFEDLPEALHPERAKFGAPFSPLQYLQLVHIDQENINAIREVLQLAGQTGQASLDPKSLYKIVKSLVSAAASLHVSESRLPNVPFFDLWPAFANPTVAEGSEQKKRLTLLLDSKKELQELVVQLQEKEEIKPGEEVQIVEDLEEVEQKDDVIKPGSSDLVLELILHWIQGSVQLSDLQIPALLPVESLIGGLAAAQLLCTDAQECYRFVLAGGLHLLVDVLQHVVGNFSATTLLALGAMECATRYAFGCEALLGWWNPDISLGGENWGSGGSSKGYSVLLKFLLQPQQQPVVQLAARVLHRLRAYELIAAIQSMVETFVEEPGSTSGSSSEEKCEPKAVSRIAVLLKQLLGVLRIREVLGKWGHSTRFSHWLALDGEDVGTLLPPCVAYGATASTSSINESQDIDPYMLSVLQERRLLPMLVALVSTPKLRSLQGQLMKSSTELVGAIETLLLALLSCRSGLLFLAHDSEVSTALLASLQRLQDLHEKDLVPLRHAIALTTAGFLCHPEDLGGMFQTCLAVVSAMDRLLGAREQSEELLWALWDLSTISRFESGRQALLMLTWFPEVMKLLVGALHTGPETSPELGFGETWRRSAVHFVAEVLQVVVSDSAAPTVAAWTPHAIAIQHALLVSTSRANGSRANNAGVYEDKDGACSGLLEWLDSAVVYHKKGAVGLLKHASAILAGGSGLLQTGSGLPAGDSMDTDANVGDQAGTNDSVNVPYQGKWTGMEAASPPLSDTAIVQMTTAFRILALVSSYPGAAAALYGEGAMAVVYSVLDQCSTALQSSSSAYDAAIDEEDMEFDGTAEDLGNNAKEHSLLGLLLPTVLFLLALLQNLQVAVQNYQNTKLVDVLLSLHHWMSSRIASYVSAPPYAWSGITQDFIAVRQVLASLLVCWPTFGWTPSLFPRLLGIDDSGTVPSPALLPMEPAVTCSVLSLLADMLPTESPQLCNSKSALSDMYRSLAVDSILGCKSASSISWHTQSPHSDQLMQAFVLHLDHICEVVSRHTSTGCGVLQDMLKLFIIRLACVKEEHAATILRLILKQIRDLSAPTMAGSEREILQVERVCQLVAGLALHPASKLVLLREGVIEVLLKACSLKRQSLTGDAASSEAETGFPAMGRWLWIVRAFIALCDPDVSLVPSRPLGRRIMEECPTFGDCCSIVSCLLTLLQVVPIGKEFEVVLEGIEKLSSHKLGRAAIGYISVQSQDLTSSGEEVTADSGKSQALDNVTGLQSAEEKLEEHHSPIFLDVWQRIKTVLESSKCAGLVITSIIRHFAMSALVLSAAGKSTCGVAALSCLFGLGQRLPMEESSREEKLEPVVRIAAILKEFLIEGDPGRTSSMDTSCLTSVPVSAIQEAHIALLAMLRIIKRPEIGKDMTEKARLVVEAQSAAFSAHRASPQRVKWAPYMRVVTALVSSTKCDSDLEKDFGDVDEFLREKDSEACVLDLRGKLVWECPTVLQDPPILPRSSLKRKTMAMIEGSRKRQGVDVFAGSILGDGIPIIGIGSTPGSGRPLPASATPISVLNRRDTFRQRKPNTSRPPSMHVDDYVARERSEVITSGSSPAPVQRSTSGSGRPPSIHVDEFMAKQQERQQLSVTGSGIDEQLLVAGRNTSLPLPDSARRSVSGLTPGTGKISEEEGQLSITPQEKGSEQQWEEVSVAESAAVGPGTRNETLDPSYPNPSAPSTTADARSEKTSSSSSSISTTTDSVHSVKTPQVADMLLLQSKVTLQTAVARNAGAIAQTQAEEVLQTISSSAVEQLQLLDASKRMLGNSTLSRTHSVPDKKASVPSLPRASEPQSSSRTVGGEQAAVPLPPINQQASESQAAKGMQATLRQSSSVFSLPGTPDSATNMKVSSSVGNEQGGPSRFPLLPDSKLREAVTPMQRLDHQNSVHSVSSVRDTRQASTPVFSARHPKELTVSGMRNVYESQASALSQPPSIPALPHLGPQVLQTTSPIPEREHRSLHSTLGTDTSAGPAKGVVSSSPATDPRPRPPDKHRERTATDVSRPGIPPPPATPRPSDATQSRPQSALPLSLVNFLSAQPSPPSYTSPSAPGPQWPTGEVVAKGVPLPHAPDSPWPGHVSNTRYVDESGIPHGMPGRPAQPLGNPPLPAGHTTPHHGAMQFSANVASHSAPTPLNAGIGSLESVPGPGLPGSHSSARESRFSVQSPSYNTLPSQIQPTPYIAPPLPAGRPTAPHASSLAVNNLTQQQQQQLQMHFQQQNMIKLQQQQLQARQHQLQQHAQSQQMQQQPQSQQVQQHAQLQQMQQHGQSQQVQQHAQSQQVQQHVQAQQIQQHPQLQQVQHLHHQQHLLGPVLMSVQGPLPPPPPPPQAPHAPHAPPPLAPPQPQPQPQQHPQQPESPAMLQQMLASPGAIQALLKDQNKLQELLEKHPKLISLLQERMSKAPA